MFSPLQVLHTRSVVRNVKGHPVAAGTRVVVVNAKRGRITVRPQPSATSKSGVKIIATSASLFVKTRAGRPSKSEK